MHRINAFHVSAWLVATVVVACNSTATPIPSAEGDASMQDASVSVVDAADAADAPTDSADAPYCPLPGKFGSPLCERCLSALCCDVILACDQDPSCHTILSCAQACLLKPNAGPCIDKCVNDTPAGVEKYKAFDACIAAPPPEGCAFDCSQ